MTGLAVQSKTLLLNVANGEMADRFWAKVDRREPNDCWPWLAYIAPTGYGQFTIRHGVPKGAHRVAYELSVGPIPSGLQLDHLCRNRACVNPAHLEPVTLQENLRRGLGSAAAGAATAKAMLARTHCKRGHAYTPSNTNRSAGTRRCRACAALRARERRQARNELA